MIKMFNCRKKIAKLETLAITDSVMLETEGSMMLKTYDNETVNLLYKNVPY